MKFLAAHLAERPRRFQGLALSNLLLVLLIVHLEVRKPGGPKPIDVKLVARLCGMGGGGFINSATRYTAARLLVNPAFSLGRFNIV